MSGREDKIYYCRDCDNEVKFIHDGGGQLICCGHPMEIKKKEFMMEE